MQQGVEQAQVARTMSARPRILNLSVHPAEKLSWVRMTSAKSSRRNEVVCL